MKIIGKNTQKMMMTTTKIERKISNIIRYIINRGSYYVQTIENIIIFSKSHNLNSSMERRRQQNLKYIIWSCYRHIDITSNDKHSIPLKLNNLFLSIDINRRNQEFKNTPYHIRKMIPYLWQWWGRLLFVVCW